MTSIALLALATTAHAQECPVLGVLDCDTRRVLQSSEPAQNQFDAYRCADGRTYDAGLDDRMWELDVSDAVGGAVTLSFDVVDPLYRGGLVVLEGDCTPDSCLTFASYYDNVVTILPKADTRYWVVTESVEQPTFDISCLPPPADGEEEEPDMQASGCGVGAALLFPLLPWMLVGRRRSRAVVKPA